MLFLDTLIVNFRNAPLLPGGCTSEFIFNFLSNVRVSYMSSLVYVVLKLSRTKYSEFRTLQKFKVLIVVGNKYHKEYLFN